MQDRPHESPVKDTQNARTPGGGGRSRFSGRLAPALRIGLRKLALALGLLLAVVFAVKAALGWVLHGRFQIETDDAYVEADTTLIAPETTGTVAEVTVMENATVKSGDILVRLVDADARARIAQAESALATAKATLANAEARLKLQATVIKRQRSPPPDPTPRAPRQITSVIRGFKPIATRPPNAMSRPATKRKRPGPPWIGQRWASTPRRSRSPC
jgi:multidrug resistance efflux pump